MNVMCICIYISNNLPRNKQDMNVVGWSKGWAALTMV